MGLDVGEKRIGVAMSDERAVLATPRETIARRSNEKDIERLLALASAEEVGGIVVGLPLSLDGSSGPQVDKVQRFVDALRARTELPVKMWDERLTTVAADEILAENRVAPAERRSVVDKIAAAIILQSYLDGNPSPESRPRERVVDS